jgi:hypothetical protein
MRNKSGLIAKLAVLLNRACASQPMRQVDRPPAERLGGASLNSPCVA